MMRGAFAIGVLAVCLAACQTSSPPAASAQAPVRPGNPMLIDSGFVQRQPTNDAQAKTFAKLPAQTMVKQTIKGKVSYVYADPDGCGCIYVGDQAALGRYKALRNPTDPNDGQGSLAPIDPGMAPANIEDLGGWEPMGISPNI